MRLSVTSAASAALALAVVVLGLGCGEGHEHSAPAADVPLTTVEGAPVLVDENPNPSIVEVHLTAQITTVDIAGKPIAMRGYNGSVPGPMLRAKVGDEVIVHFKNELPEETTVHWHGLRIPDSMDGSPRLQAPVPPGGEFTYRFKVPEAGSFWYHPHVRAHTNVEAGLYAPIVISDPTKDPEYDVERYLMLDDLLLVNGERPPPFTQGHPEMMHGRWGNLLLTNGQPSENAGTRAEQGMVERWRLVNTANGRTMVLELEGATFRVIGTDGGLLPQPYTTKRIVLPVGQRYDLEVVYDRPGTAKLLSMIRAFGPDGKIVEQAWPVFVVDVAASARAPRTHAWPAIELPNRAPEAEGTITIDAVAGGEHGVEWRLNGLSHSNEPLFTYNQGQTVKLKLVNKLGPEHPFHLHGQFFTVVDPGQPGLKDTVLVPGMGTVEVIAYMDNPGRWMAHCHILEHAELGMMSEIVVNPASGPPIGPAPHEGHGH